MRPEAFYRRVMDSIGDEDRPGAVQATAAVFGALRDRLTVTEAAQVCAQLPAGLKEVWQVGDCADRRPRKIHREEFYQRVARDGKLPRREARRATIAVLSAPRAQLSPGESDDVQAQLPRDLKVREIVFATDFSDASANAARVAVQIARRLEARLHVLEGDPRRHRPRLECCGPGAKRRRPMKAGDLMTANPVTVTPTTTIAEAWDLMTKLEIRHLPIVEKGSMVGIVSDRDLAVLDLGRLYTEEGAGAVRRALARTVEEVMSPEVVDVDPAMPLGNAALCLDCEHVFGLAAGCPVCGSEQFVLLATFLERPERPWIHEPDAKETSHEPLRLVRPAAGGKHESLPAPPRRDRGWLGGGEPDPVRLRASRDRPPQRPAGGAAGG